jgi:hypothetical protein
MDQLGRFRDRREAEPQGKLRNQQRLALVA